MLWCFILGKKNLGGARHKWGICSSDFTSWAKCKLINLSSCEFQFFNMFQFTAGDMEFKHNKFLSFEKQIVTANPDINTISWYFL